MRAKLQDNLYGEFEIQAFVFTGLLSMGYRVRGEVSSASIFENKEKRKARFDLVIFDDKWKPLEIIETKHPNYSIEFKESKQYGRYIRFGIPVKFAKSMKTAFELLDYYHRHKNIYEHLYGLNTYSETVSNFLSLLNNSD